MADIETLLGLTAGTGTDPKALAAQLRGQQDLGAFLSLSGSEPIRAMGEAERASAETAARRGGALRQATARDEERKRQWEAERADLGAPKPYQMADGSVAYMQYDPTTQSMVPAQGMEDVRPYTKPTTRKPSTAMPQAYTTDTGETVHVVSDGAGGFRTVDGQPITSMRGWQKNSTGGGLKPTGAERKNVRKSADLIERANIVNDKFKAMTAMQREQVDSPKWEVMFNMVGDDLGNYIQSEFYDPDVRDYLSSLASIEADLSKIQAGLSVTGYEMSDRKKWSPFAPGIGQEERQRRLHKIQEDLGREISGYNRMYEGYQVEPPEPRFYRKEKPQKGIPVRPAGRVERRALPTAATPPGAPPAAKTPADMSDEEFLEYFSKTYPDGAAQ